eukprot:TRINITY_DN26524_c0_g1_i1.p1 TRINITY_DN26524_c0_g1~~TRINITY_DN26524_c0_g1_i1.p1  ORF type:complete len:101 (+),score=8.45 TRINITY_DN26524_c0_g1_i1:89-391(+)
MRTRAAGATDGGGGGETAPAVRRVSCYAVVVPLAPPGGLRPLQALRPAPPQRFDGEGTGMAVDEATGCLEPTEGTASNLPAAAAVIVIAVARLNILSVRT